VFANHSVEPFTFLKVALQQGGITGWPPPQIAGKARSDTVTT
jgi:hypothetical protein